MVESKGALVYIGIFVDDFLGITQGNKARVKRALLHSLNDVMRPLSPTDLPTREDPASLKNMKQGDSTWAGPWLNIPSVPGISSIMLLSSPKSFRHRFRETHCWPSTYCNIVVKRVTLCCGRWRANDESRGSDGRNFWGS